MFPISWMINPYEEALGEPKVKKICLPNWTENTKEGKKAGSKAFLPKGPKTHNTDKHHHWGTVHPAK